MSTRSPRPLLPLASLLLALPASAGDVRVPAGGSIQAAIDAAADGDRLFVAPGRFAEALDFRGKAIAVIAPAGPQATVVDATGLGVPVVSFHSGEGPRSRLVGFTLRGGTAVGPGIAGAGVSAWLAGVSASPTIEDCIVRDNVARGASGGGVAGAPSLLRCSIFDNQAGTGEGGGVFGTPRMRLCVVASNRASDGGGGGLAVRRGAARVQDCVFLDNESVFTGRGGGVLVGGSASLGMSGSLLLGNLADAGVQATSLGGALLVEAGGSALLDRCTVVGNRVQTSVGGGDVGGVAGPAALSDTIVRRNAGLQVAGARASYCDVQGGARGTGNFDADPDFVDPADGDFHLAAGSPCIDAGDPARPDPNGSPADVGAFRFQDLYTRANTARRRFVDPGWPELSALVGGHQDLRLLAGPRLAGQPYRILGTTSGTRPGFLLQGLRVPLNPDPYTRHTFSFPNGPLLFGGAGLLDRAGRADARVVVPAMRRLRGGLLFDHAGLVFLGPRPGTLVRVSRAEDLVVR